METKSFKAAPEWVRAYILEDVGRYSGGRYGRHFGGRYHYPVAGERYVHVAYRPDLKVGDVETAARRFPFGNRYIFGETVQETVHETWYGFVRTECLIVAPPSAQAYGQDRSGPVWLCSASAAQFAEWQAGLAAAAADRASADKLRARIARKPDMPPANKADLQRRIAALEA
jgi:hypothetical protein